MSEHSAFHKVEIKEGTLSESVPSLICLKLLVLKNCGCNNQEATSEGTSIRYFLILL